MAMSKIGSRLLLLAVAAAWLASSICSARDKVLLMPSEKIDEKFTFYPVLPFDTAQATQKRYSRFINYVREELVSGDTVHGIPRLYNPVKLEESDRYLQVALFNSDEERITLAIDKADIYVVGYRTDYEACFFADTDVEETASVFPGITRRQLPFETGYWPMEQIVGSRRNISLGMSELDECIKHLHDLKDNSSLARCMIITIQMVAEAVRYRYVENLVVEHIGQTDEAYLPTDTMITFEENWKELSARIQESIGGVISPPIALSDASNQEVTITSITPTLGRNIALVLYVCDSCTNVPEPAVRIIGRNGLCADVQDGFYNDGNPVILWPCKSTNYTNQLWTLMEDGTIQSQGKCLTAYRLEIQQYVMIHNCTTTPEYSSKQWTIEDNGNIINKDSKLALSAYTGYSWSLLTLEQKAYSSSQGWSATNTTEPVETPIFSYKNTCIEASGNNTVKVSSCSEQSVQQWALYSDGTVRPSMSTTNCIKSKSSSDGKVLVHDVCDGGDTERWLFNHDRSVSNVANKYVWEVNKNNKITVVKRSADTPTTKQIFDIKYV